MREAKAVVAAIGTIATSLTAILADDVFTLNEGASLAATLVLVVGTVAAVYGVSNKPASDAEHRLPGTGSVG